MAHEVTENRENLKNFLICRLHSILLGCYIREAEKDRVSTLTWVKTKQHKFCFLKSKVKITMGNGGRRENVTEIGLTEIGCRNVN
jgi:hypothetical protein